MKRPCIFYLVGGALLVPNLTQQARADLRSYYAFGLDGYVGGNQFSSYLSLNDDFRFNSGQARLYGDNFRVAAGDLSGDFDSLSLSNRTFQGIQATVPAGRSEFTVIAGRTIMPLSLLDLARNPGGFLDDDRIRDTSSVYGLRASYSLSQNLKINASQLFTPDTSSLEGKSISNASLVYAPDSSSRLALEGAHSRRGEGFQLSGEKRTGSYSVLASYRHADPEFSTAGNLNLRANRTGYRLLGSYQVWGNTTLSGTTYRYRDGFGGHSLLNTVALGFPLQRRRRAGGGSPRLAFTFQDRELQNADITGGENQKLRGPGVRFTSQVKQVAFLAGYDKLDLDAGTTHNEIQRFILSASRPLGPTSSLLLFSSVDFERKNNVLGRTRDFQTSINYNRSFANNTFTLQTGLERRAVSSSSNQGIEGTSYALRFALSVPVGRNGRMVGFDYRRQLSARGDIADSYADVLYLSYRQPISIGKRPPQFALRQLSDIDRKNLGRVVARVYQDLNLNGRRDSDEPGVKGILIGLTDDVRGRTDDNGEVRFANLPANQYALQLVVPSIPIELSLLDDYNRSVSLGARQNLDFDFAVSPTGSLSGVVFDDSNRNGVRDEGEKGVRDALVRVEGTEVITFSGLDGAFILTNVPPGQRTLEVDTNFLSEVDKTYNVTTPSIGITLAPGAKAEVGVIGVAVVQTPVIIGQLPNAVPAPIGTPLSGDIPTVQPIVHAEGQPTSPQPVNAQ